jgi:acetate kinase
MVAALGGVDGLVFTGGVGENSAEVRQAVADGLGFLGVQVDPPSNLAVNGEGEVGPPHARVRTLVVRAREDLEIARQTRSVLSSEG